LLDLVHSLPPRFGYFFPPPLLFPVPCSTSPLYFVISLCGPGSCSDSLFPPRSPFFSQDFFLSAWRRRRLSYERKDPAVLFFLFLLCRCSVFFIVYCLAPHGSVLGAARNRTWVQVQDPPCPPPLLLLSLPSHFNSPPLVARSSVRNRGRVSRLWRDEGFHVLFSRWGRCPPPPSYFLSLVPCIRVCFFIGHFPFAGCEALTFGGDIMASSLRDPLRSD